MQPSSIPNSSIYAVQYTNEHEIRLPFVNFCNVFIPMAWQSDQECGAITWKPKNSVYYFTLGDLDTVQVHTSSSSFFFSFFNLKSVARVKWYANTQTLGIERLVLVCVTGAKREIERWTAITMAGRKCTKRRRSLKSQQQIFTAFTKCRRKSAQF